MIEALLLTHHGGKVCLPRAQKRLSNLGPNANGPAGVVCRPQARGEDAPDLAVRQPPTQLSVSGGRVLEPLRKVVQAEVDVHLPAGEELSVIRLPKKEEGNRCLAMVQRRCLEVRLSLHPGVQGQGC